MARHAQAQHGPVLQECRGTTAARRLRRPLLQVHTVHAARFQGGLCRCLCCAGASRGLRGHHLRVVQPAVLWRAWSTRCVPAKAAPRASPSCLPNLAPLLVPVAGTNVKALPGDVRSCLYGVRHAASIGKDTTFRCACVEQANAGRVYWATSCTAAVKFYNGDNGSGYVPVRAAAAFPCLPAGTTACSTTVVPATCKTAGWLPACCRCAA